MTEHTSGQYEDERVTRKLVSKPERDALAKRLAQLSPQQRSKILNSVQPRVVEKYMAHIPHPRQQVFLSLSNREVMFGGSGGGGKSDALLMSALSYVDVPGYSALLLRTTWPDLNKAGAILDRANQWFGGTDARKREGGRIWEFPTYDKDGNPALPARISFGYLDKENDKYKLQCFTPDHDLLTKRGWIPVAEVTKDDLVASVDPMTEKMSWEKVDATMEYPHRGFTLDVFQHNGLSMKVTMNHKLWVKDFSATENQNQLYPVRADELKATDHIPLTINHDNNHTARFSSAEIVDVARADYANKRVSLFARSLGTNDARMYLETVSSPMASGRRRISATTVRQKYLDDLMAMATIAGLRCTLSNEHVVDAHTKRRELTWSTLSNGGYADLSLAMERPSTQNYARKVMYYGNVYCVSTSKYQTLVVRHRGRVHVSGNSAEYQFIGFDELTQFLPSVYTYSFSRLRKPAVSCLNCAQQLKLINDAWVHGRPDKCTTAIPDPKVVAQYAPSKDGMTIFDVPLRVRSACVDAGDVLTHDGWKDIKDIKTGELVASLNAYGVMQYKPVTQTFVYDYDDELVRVRKKNLYMSMTPNHRVTYRRSYSATSSYVTERFDEHTAKTMAVVRAPERIEQAGYTDDILGWGIDNYLKFLGIFLADGSTNATVINGNYKTVITKSEPIVAGIIREVMDQLPHNYAYSKNGDFQITNKAVREHFVQFGKSHEKFIPRDVLTKANAEQLRTLFEWITMGDGHRRGNSYSYTTVSPRLANDVAELGVKLGYKVMTTKKIVDNEKHHDQYIIYLTMSDRATTLIDKGDERSDVENEHFTGKVYCIEVEDNHNFLIRQKGTVWVSGNSNPGGRSHDYVRDRFVNPKTRDKRSLFIPSSIHDNPSLDYDEYVKSLEYLDPLEKARMLNGDWDVAEMGEMFKREYFKMLRVNVEPEGRAVRWWDNASSDGKGDYTVGLKMILTRDGRFVISDVVRGQWSTHKKKQIMLQTAHLDGTSVSQRMEQEPGSSGVDVIDDMRRNVFMGYDFQGIRSTGDKVTRATPFASASEGGLVYLMPGQWNKLFIDEVVQFPNGGNDDQVDSASSAHNFLSGGRRVRLLV